MKYGLLGEKLTHSFSKEIHESFKLYEFSYFEVKREELEKFMIAKDFDGITVTIPYKSEVMKYLDNIDEKARKIGAVNTIVNRNGVLYGYNTDYDGVVYSLKKKDIDVRDKKILILGNGATSKTITKVLEDLGAREIIKVSRKEYPFIKDYENFLDFEILINATPVGMYPNNLKSLVDLEKFEKLEGIFDVVYNPLKTKLILDGERLKINSESGMDMLVSQAKKAAEYFLDRKLSDRLTIKAIEKIYRKKSNIILIGMPGAGKSSIGKKISEITGKKHFDLDFEFEREYGNIEKYFKEVGEESFREIESRLVRKFGKKSGAIISTGGGVILNRKNYYPLKQNGIIFNVKRSLDKLDKRGRPLSQKYDVKELYEKRKELYQEFQDYEITNDENLDKSAKEVLSIFYENFSD